MGGEWPDVPGSASSFDGVCAGLAESKRGGRLRRPADKPSASQRIDCIQNPTRDQHLRYPIASSRVSRSTLNLREAFGSPCMRLARCSEVLRGPRRPDVPAAPGGAGPLQRQPLQPAPHLQELSQGAPQCPLRGTPSSPLGGGGSACSWGPTRLPVRRPAPAATLQKRLYRQTKLIIKIFLSN